MGRLTGVLERLNPNYPVPLADAHSTASPGHSTKVVTRWLSARSPSLALKPLVLLVKPAGSCSISTYNKDLTLWPASSKGLVPTERVQTAEYKDVSPLSRLGVFSHMLQRTFSGRRGLTTQLASAQMAAFPHPHCGANFNQQWRHWCSRLKLALLYYSNKLWNKIILKVVHRILSNRNKALLITSYRLKCIPCLVGYFLVRTTKREAAIHPAVHSWPHYTCTEHFLAAGLSPLPLQHVSRCAHVQQIQVLHVRKGCETGALHSSQGSQSHSKPKKLKKASWNASGLAGRYSGDHWMNSSLLFKLHYSQITHVWPL